MPFWVPKWRRASCGFRSHARIGGAPGGTHIGMVPQEDAAGLALESPLGFGICSEVFGKDFYSNRAVQTAIIGAIHLAHATYT
jgi:hypothetical protein